MKEETVERGTEIAVRFQFSEHHLLLFGLIGRPIRVNEVLL